MELHINVAQGTGFFPVVAGQVHGLLRRAGTLDRHGRLGEQSSATLQVSHAFPSIGRQFKEIVAGNAVLAKAAFQALDGAQVQLQSRRNHQKLVIQ